MCNENDRYVISDDGRMYLKKDHGKCFAAVSPE